MFDLPPLPKVLNNRHITCVRCKEKFVISEGRQSWEQWRQTSNEPLHIRLQHEENRQIQPVSPLPLAEPPSRAEPRLFWDTAVSGNPLTDIHCPRCGADNRNWLTINDNTNLPPRFLLGLPVSGQFSARFPGAFVTRYIAIVFAILAIVLIFVMQINLAKAVLLLLFIPAAIVGIIWELTREWNELRENRHIRLILPKTKNKETELWARGLILVFLFTIAFPLLFFSLVPATFRIFLEFAEDSAEEQVSEATNMVSLGVNEQTETIQNKYTTLAVEIQNLIDDLPSENLPQLEAEIETLSNKLADTYMLSETTLEQLQAETALLIQSRRSEELAKVTKARNQAISGLADGIVADLSFLALWGVIIGPTTLITVLIAMSSVKSFVHRIDRELPPPIFHNVAGMTRLVAWEAKQALEAKQTFIVDNDGNTRHIQWMSVNRNENGGIDLIGLFRDLPEFDMYGRPSSQTVRAQRHTIKTDLWGRVVKAEITDVMVPLPAGAPYYVPPTEKKRIAHDALHIRRP